MRYGENVFDQHSSIIQDSILKSDLPREEKERLMGIHTLAELETHAHNQEDMAKGGKTKKKQDTTSSRFTVPKGLSADLTAAKSLYNNWAMQKGLPIVPNNGIIDDNTAAAFANYNADPANMRKISVASNPYFDVTSGSKKEMATAIKLSEFLPELKGRTADAIRGYDSSGNYVYSDQVDPTIRDAKLNKILVVNKDFKPVPTGTMSPDSKPQTFKPAANRIVDGREVRERQFKNNSAVSSITSLVGAGIGGILASEEVPRWEPTQQYKDMVAEVSNNRNMGLTPEEIASANQSADQNYANGVESIRQIAGGGGTQGSVLAALQGLSSNRDRANLNLSLANSDAVRQNQSIFRSTVLNDQSIDRQVFEQDRANAMETRQNGAAMLQQGAQALYDQQLFNRSYGPGSVYNETVEGDIAATENYNSLTALQTQLALERLRNVSIGSAPTSYGATAPRSARQLPSVTIPTF